MHVKLDTGMGRAGIPARGAPARRRAPARARRGLRVAGTFTQPRLGRKTSGSPRPRRRSRPSGTALGALRRRRDPAGSRSPRQLGGRSSAHPDSWLRRRAAGARSLRSAAVGMPTKAELSTPAMTLETRVMSVRPCPGGHAARLRRRVRHRARPSTIAVLPIGYHDGFRRSFSGRVSVLLRGKEAPVVGAVSMDLTLVDATGCGARTRRPGRLPRAATAAHRVTAWDLARAAGHDPLRDPLRDRPARAAQCTPAVMRLLEAIGRVVLRVLEELGRFFQMLGRIASGPCARPTTSRSSCGRWSGSASTRSRSSS